jgi:hypothetical protein
MKRFLQTAASAFLVTALVAGPVAAQEGATMRGLITDKQGNPLPGATITIRSASNPSVNNQGTVANAKGEYRLPLLPAGDDYEVTCAFPGFTTIIKRPVNLDAGKVTAVSFVLTEEMVQKIVVEAKGDIIDTEKTSTSTAVSTEFVAGLPILGRNYSDVLTLAPGVTDNDGDGNPNVKGSREVDFQLQISGVQVNDPFSGTKALDFNIEAIEEINILTGALSAEYSSQGGVGSVTTRSGGNEFEGSFKMFYQSRAFDGDGANNRDFISNSLPAPQFHTIRPFLTAGGAFKKDRLWYFTALEYTDQQEPVVFGAATKNRSESGHRDFAKLTWQVNPEHKASLELYYEPSDTAGNNIAPTISPDSDLLIDSVGKLYTARETAVFSPTVFLDSTVSLFQVNNTLYPVFQPVLSVENDKKVYRIPGMEDRPMLDFLERNQFAVNPPDQHYLIDLNSRTVSGPFYLNQTTDGKQFTVREDLSFYVDDFVGSHSLKTGLEWQNQRHHENSEFRPRVFKDKERGQEIFNFQAPIPAGDVPLGAERYNIGFYMQDTWKPFPNLTVNVGVRMDREVMQSIGRSLFDPAAEVDEYNRTASLFYKTPSAVGNELGALGQIRLENNGGLNFNTNPLTETFFCDLDGDGNCDGRTSATSESIPGVPGNSDRAVLRGILSRDNFDCSLVSSWQAVPGLATGSGRLCTGADPGVREGTDLTSENVSIGNTNLAPRLSFSWDPFADGKTKMYATWGRFYGALFLDTAVREKRADLQSFTFTLPANDVALRDPNEGAFTIYQISRDLRTPYTDEFTLGVERELAPELAVKVVFTRKDGRNQLQDKDVNHVTVDRTGGPGNTSDGLNDDCLSGILPQVGLCLPDGSPDIEPLNPNFNQIFLLGNFNFSQYRSLELVLTRRLHRNWQFETSYTWSEAIGNAESFNSVLGDDPSQVQLERGFLEYDQRHVVKFNAIAHLPKEFSLGGSIEYQSGLPFSVVRRDFVSDNLGNGTFRTIFPTSQRNDQRNTNYWLFNTNVKKSLTFGRVKAVASFDIINLLNSDTLRIYDVNLANQAGLQISDPQNPATRQFGRRFQLGIELHF